MKAVILGISGKMGVGKNYVSEAFVIPQLMEMYAILHPRTRLVPYFFSFGSFIKSELYARDASLSYESLFDAKTTETRRRLQEYGTELGRQSVGKDMWIRALELWMRIQTEGLARIATHDRPLFIIQDIRFPNELAFVKAHADALIIRVEAEDRHIRRLAKEKSNGMHISETALDDVAFQYVIQNQEDRSHDAISSDVAHILRSFLLETTKDV